MAMDPKQSHQYLQAKKSEEEEDHPFITNHPLNSSKFPAKITSSRQWSTYKNPRIVRVSRAFGGKDRHSKVCTVKGLRDRRIRLSAPTAIQLYDLQERLGLSQPSKVVDWLIEATKEDIDKLPPLPMIPQFLQPNEPLLQPISINNQSLLYKDLVVDHQSVIKNDKENQDHHHHQGFGGFVPLSNYQGLSHYNVGQPWEHCTTAPNLTLSQFGGGFSLSSIQSMAGEDHHQAAMNLNMANAVMVPSFPSYNIITSSMENSENVTPTTFHFISSSPNTRSSLGLNVNYGRSLFHSLVNDQEKSR